jgi:hypothetical protein
LQQVLHAGLEQTAPLWPRIAHAYGWVEQAAQILNNDAGQDGLLVRRDYRALLVEMAAQQETVGELAGAVRHFRKVTRSYWPGLFQCYEHAAIPRTNNDLEQCFGGVRYHERRASGRKGAAPGLVVRGQVRLIAAVVTRTQEVGAATLRPQDLAAWRRLRRELEYRQEARRQQLRFRRDPQAYLRQLEEQLLKPSLPS